MDTDKEKVLNEIKKSIQSEVETLKSGMKDGLISKDDFETQIKSINEKVDKMEDSFAEKSIIDEVKTNIEGLNTKFEALKLNKQKAVNFVDQIIEKTKTIAKDYKAKGKASGDVELNLKSGAVNLGLSTTTGEGVIDADRETGINYAPKRRPIMMDVILSGSTNSNIVEWVEKTDEAGTPAFKKEFETFPKRSWKTVLKQLTVKKIAVMAEYSREILEDLDGFEAELRRDLVEQIQLLLDQNILDGTGGGDTDADLKGILDYAQSWDNGTFGVAKPTIYDVIAVGVNQVVEEHFSPSVIVMRPATALAMKLSKDDNGNYVMPPFASSNGVNVEGLPVITTTNPGIAADGILIMDGSRAQFMWKRNWTLEMTDSHDDNFANEVLAVRLSGRGVLKIKDVDTKAFVYIADYNTGIAALKSSS